MSFSEMSKQEAIRLIEAKIKGEEHCYSSIVNEAVRMIKEERAKVEMLEQENGDMAEKHAEKDIALTNLYQDYKRLKEALEEISQIGYSDKFGGGWTYTGEYHARCMKIAMETLKKSY